MVRSPNGANHIQAAGTSALCKSQVGSPLRNRYARLGKDGRALEVSRFEKGGLPAGFAILFDPELPAKLQEQSRGSEDR
jgi:hypothetical protein